MFVGGRDTNVVMPDDFYARDTLCFVRLAGRCCFSSIRLSDGDEVAEG